MSSLATRYVIVVLSLGIVVLMLGIPATLLNPMGQTDSFTASLLEGFTLPQIAHIHQRLPKLHTLPTVSSSAALPVLGTSLFRPPIQ